MESKPAEDLRNGGRGELDAPRPRVCVVMTARNARLAIESAVLGVLEHTRDVYVVDDGSTDGTLEILVRLPGIRIVGHDASGGRGAAVASGLAAAFEDGFTHAVSMDATGRHPADDLPTFLQAIAEAPDALIVGTRRWPKEGERRKSGIFRGDFSFWAWILTGERIRDPRSGYHAYPLARFLDLVLAERGDFEEIEALVKALWTGTKVVEVPVREVGAGGGKPRFPALDSLRLTWLVFLLWLRRLLLPEPVLVHLCLKSHRKDGKRSMGSLIKDVLRHECPTARHFSLSVALGVFCGLSPIWGGQMYAAIIAAHKLRLSKTLSVLSSNVSFPAAIPFIIYASVQLGRLICGGPTDDMGLPESGQAVISISQYAFEYVIGALVLASSAGTVVGAVAYLAARRLSWFRRENRGGILEAEGGTEP